MVAVVDSEAPAVGTEEVPVVRAVLAEAIAVRRWGIDPRLLWAALGTDRLLWAGLDIVRLRRTWVAGETDRPGAPWAALARCA